MVFQKIKEDWFKKRKEENEPRNRSERRARLFGTVRCPNCHVRYRWVNDERHTDNCRGYIQRPKKTRKHKVVAPWPRSAK